MNTRKSMPHEQAVELLPWLINGSMDEDEEEKVRQHAHSCVACRRELQELELISNFIAEAARSEPIPPPDMRNINARIDAYMARKGRLRRRIARFLGWDENRWRLAFALQSLLVVALAVALLWPASDSPEYTTLSRPQMLPEGHYIRAVFEPGMVVSDLAELLQDMDLEVASGPSARGVYTLSVAANLSDGARAELLTRLQQNPDVQFAQWAVHR